MSADLERLLLGHRAVVCVGTGGVGKTTVAAALGLAAASLGRRTMVLTIDPARQLARALGLETLSRQGEAVPTAGVAAAGLLHAGMLDQKGAWDAFIARHAPNDDVRDTLLENPFYQKLSTSLAGSTEYMAIEELCRLDESGEYDLIIIDTPPSGRAIDFLRAPERIEKLLDQRGMTWLTGPSGSASLHALSGTVKFVVRRLERLVGSRTLRELSAFFVALDALFGDVAARAARARALLRGPETAFVLVAGPMGPALAGAAELTSAMAELGAPLRAVVVNRVHPLPGSELTSEAVAAGIATVQAPPGVAAWLLETWQAASAVAGAERGRLARFRGTVPAEVGWVEVAELDHDAHSLDDLAALARALVGGA